MCSTCELTDDIAKVLSQAFRGLMEPWLRGEAVHTVPDLRESLAYQSEHAQKFSEVLPSRPEPDVPKEA